MLYLALLFSIFLWHPFSHKITKENVFDVIGKTEWVIVHFFADGCKHCGEFEPVWNEVSRMYKPVDGIKLATINCDRWNQLCVMFDGTSTPGVQVFAPRERRGQVFGGKRETLPLVKWIRNHTGIDPFTKPGSLLFASPEDIAETQKENWVLVATDNPRKLFYNHTALRDCEDDRFLQLRALSNVQYPEKTKELCGADTNNCLVLTNGKQTFKYEGQIDTDALLDFIAQHISDDL